MRALVLIPLATILAATVACGGTGTNQPAPQNTQPQQTTSEATVEESPQGTCPSAGDDVAADRQAGDAESRPVPDVRGNDLLSAICRVLAAGFTAATAPVVVDIPYDRLENLIVLEQEPAPERLAPTGSVITITKFDRVFPTPPPIPDSHPESVSVPDLVGMGYVEAVAALEPGLVPAVDLGALPPLPPEKSIYGLDAYVVAAQMPAAGTELPFVTNNPIKSQVVLTLVLRQ